MKAVYSKERVIRAFTRRNGKVEQLTPIAAAMDDQSLLWAYILPDHTQNAKSVIAQQLERRGYAKEQIENWLPGPQDFAIPSGLRKRVTWKSYAAIGPRRAFLFRFYRLLVVVSIICLALIMVPQLADSAFLKNTFTSAVLLLMFTLVVSGLLFKPFALRILLLRPFGERRMTASLKRFVRKNLGTLGYVYTLSDRSYRPANPILIYTLMAFSEVFVLMLNVALLTSFRIATVRNGGSFRKLETFLARKRYTASALAFQSGGQAFNVRSTDPWWKICILMLMSSCEVIVVDLSRVKAGTTWELDHLYAAGIESKCLFIVSEDKLPELNVVLKEHFGANSSPSVFTYHANGELLEPERFRAALEEVALCCGRFEQPDTQQVASAEVLVRR